MKSQRGPGMRPGHRHRRRFGRGQDTGRGDPYEATRKPPEPAVCSQCGAVHHLGRWSWQTPPRDSVATLCAACQRIKDEYPAGKVVLKGAYVQKHRDDLINLARHQGELERSEHPMNRIMNIEEEGGALVISTTDIHLPHRIGAAVHHAHHGELKTSYDEDGYFSLVEWERADE